MKLSILSAAAAAGVAGAVAVVPAAAAPTRTVAVRDNSFSPAATTVGRGTTIRWVWRGGSPHNVTVISGPRRFRSGNRTRGATFRRRLSRPGLYRINCTIHPGMTQTIRVR